MSKVKVFDGPGAKKARQKVAQDKQANNAQAQRARTERKAAWPQQGEATLNLAPGKTATATPAGVPVTLNLGAGKASKDQAAAQGTARVTVLNQKAARKAGITGVLLAAESDRAGAADIAVDYSGFASAIGGGWAQRLSLVQLPACALTTPQKAECRKETPLTSNNDVTHQTVSAKLNLAANPGALSPQLMRSADVTTAVTVLAVTAATSSAGSGLAPTGTGNYSATPLSASSSWQAGGSSGAFTWSYDFTAPPAAAGPVPSLSLSYDSGSIDGRTATTNNQGTSVGEGFTLSESYIERTYGSCDEDGHADLFDLCWKYDNARLVLNGKSTRLIKDDDTGTWRLEDDDASIVTRSTGASNGDDNGEYWTITTGDGTKYVFGQDKLDGADTQRTNSTWTVAVFGDDSGEPGYANGDTFDKRSTVQAWRWNLDYVEDPDGNAATYWYTKESNYYKKNKATTASSYYIRGGYLDRIEYGLRKNALFTDKADARFTFGYTERCTAADCSSLTKDTAQNWPDVPFDAICSKDDADCDAAGPSFFTRKRLTGIATSSYNTTSGAFDPVDSWAFVQEYLDGGDIGDSSDQVLTLKSLTRTGKAGDTSIALKPISFTYQMRSNRVDATDNILPMTRPRISTVTSETGAITRVTLSAPECVRSEVLNAAPDTNTRSCYPQYWHINGAENASIDWFHKYRVLAVTVADPAANNEAVEHAYDYSGAAWHYADDPMTPKDERTWSDWRGYRQVTTWTGATDATRSKSVSLYLQGMDGDINKDGTTKTVPVAPLSVPKLGVATIADADQYAGQLREQVAFAGATAISATVNDPWSQETARQSPPDAGDHVARYIRTQKTHNYTYLTASGTWRERQTETSFDSYGMPVTVDDDGQIGKGSDETCTRTWYARNTNLGITSLASRIRTVARQCSTMDTSLNLPATSATSGDVLSDTATVYDTPNATGWTSTQKPTKGQVTWTGRATGYAATADANGDRLPTGWQAMATTTYDTLGRPLSITDNAGHTTSTAYTPVDAGPLTKTITTGPQPMQYKAVSFLDPRRGLALRSYDINLQKTEQRYDALGRLTNVWLPNRDSSSQSPNLTFDYHLDNAKPSWVSTATLKSDGTTYNTSYVIYDALLRPLQTQAPTPLGGRLLTDTRYDTRGLAYETYADIYDTTSTPNGTYTRAEYGEAPQQTETVFDGAGRGTTSTLYVFGEEKWSTATSYTGDSVATTALEGGSAQRTITDVRGRTVESREYAGADPADSDYGTSQGTSYTSTRFTYGLDGRQDTITGPDNTKWTYVYDLFGRQIRTTDPDKGTTTTEYNALDQVIKSTDSLQQSVLTDYDELGRITGTWSGSKTEANQLTAYTYDSVHKGLPTSSTRYVGGKATGDAYTQTVTEYDSLDRATHTQLELPADDPFVKAGQPSTLAFETYYKIDGTLNGTKEPAAGGLPSEAIDYHYDGLGDLTSFGGATGYLDDVSYSQLAQPLQLTLGTGGTGNKYFFVNNTFEEGTGRLTRSNVTDQTHPYMLQDLNYTYDKSGNVTAISDPTTLGGTSSADTQCFDYDGHQRLLEAWTPTSQKCTDTPDAASLSGPAPYWTSYTYNTAGQRTAETTHTTSGNTKTTYCYTDTKQPHTLRGTTTGTDCTTPQRTYDYDTTGNTSKRPGQSAGHQQDLAWSPEGQLTKLTEDDKSTDYVYDANGNLLIRATENGERILYAGSTELHLRTDGTTWAQRYYTAAGITAAMRSNQTGTSKLTYLASDQHGTSSLTISPDTSQTYTKRYTTPFGEDRGAPLYGPWPDDKGFLGKTRDAATGLTHIGAREYDPTIGQFLSVDPVLDTSNAQSFNGYAYADNNPATESDPTGLCPVDLCGGGEGKGGSTSGEVTKVDPSSSVYWDVPPPSSGGKSKKNGTAQGGGNTGNGRGDGDGNGSPSPAEQYRCGVMGCQAVNNPEWCQHNEIYCKVISYGPALEKASKQAWEAEKDLLGIAHFEDCKNGDLDACVQLSQDAIFRTKLKLVERAFDIAKGNSTGTGTLKPNCKCFLAGTDVLMADGTTKNIENVKAGDKVLATDPETGKTGPRTVDRLIVNDGDKYFNELFIATADGTQHITATNGHPFWSPSEHEWIEAGALIPGMTLLTVDGTAVKVTANRPFIKHVRTYNLTVDGLHTYYVLAGNTPILVHNSSCPRFIVDESGNILELPEVSSTISRQRQERHILGGKGYRNGGYFNSQEDAQAVLDAYHSGQAQVMGVTKTGNIQIRVNSVTGYDNNPARQRFGVPTNVFMIKGTKSPSVVPMNPYVGAP